MSEKFDTSKKFIISIGEFCATANLLKENNIRKESFPFDWIFSNLLFIKECLQTNFKPFHYCIEKQIQDYPSKYENVVFTNVGFPHRDMKSEETKHYYNKRIKAFYKALKSDFPKIFIHINGIPKENINDNQMKEVIDELKKICNGTFIILSFQIQQSTELHQNICLEKEKGDHITKYTIYINSEDEFDISTWLLEKSHGKMITKLLKEKYNLSKVLSTKDIL